MARIDVLCAMNAGPLAFTPFDLPAVERTHRTRYPGRETGREELFNIGYTQIPHKEVKDNSEAVAEVAQLASLDGDEVMKHNLSAGDSARFGRLLLEQYASDPGLAPFVKQALERTHASDNLIIDVSLPSD
jgi:hypothetical protein